VKWTPRTPPRTERNPPAPRLSTLPSPSKKVDLRISPATMAGPPIVARPDFASSGLSITRPQWVGPVPAAEKQQAQSPLKVLTPKHPVHTPPHLTRTQSAQASQPITPVKFGAGSPSIQRTSLVSSFFRLLLMLNFIVLGVVAGRGRTCLGTPSPTGNHPKAA
jgi:hypothetical protein